jgi:hypothetical protein
VLSLTGSYYADGVNNGVLPRRRLSNRDWVCGVADEIEFANNERICLHKRSSLKILLLRIEQMFHLSTFFKQI